MSKWVTAGVANWGLGFLDAFFAGCKAKGVDPLCLFWVWGDSVSPAAITNGVNDKYQKMPDGSPIFITADKADGWARTLAAKAKAAGVNPIVVIEHEGQKNGVMENPASFVAYFNRMADSMRSVHPGVKIAFCSAIWVDQAAVASKFATCIAKADLLALQTLLFAPRHPVTDFTGAGPRFAKAFATLRAAAPGKPAAIIDLGFSSYGGAYSKAHPFAGGDGKANEPLQAAAIKSVADAAAGMNLKFVVYRSLGDDPRFDIANYGGWAERSVGLVRLDGSRKPAFDVLMALAKPPAPPPEPKTRTEVEYATVLAQLAVSRAETVETRKAVDTAKIALADATVKLQAATDEAAALKAKIEKAKADLA